ncbi:Spy/CpxP family protein refolding chaperone [Arachidicoccus soli]|uniref:Periplasmic heavy metal sensor n=1 Tax=Arachidicoccus soli TaxID=2341117 RepID=A0A386HUM7_9BACT|nr:Spy/CpxP family protein refolding chaperone [Arachidicoccus soli]AYD49200.1 hypothetical protein D6B99_17160 [Arachidicoccus soli]
MKKIFLLSFAFLLFTALTKAQDANTTTQTTQKEGMHRGGMHGMNSQLMKQLNLTPDQKTQLKALNESMKTKREAIKNNASLSDEQKKEAFRSLMKENMKDRDAIYTPEQKALIEKSRKERMAQWKSKKASPDSQ